MDTDVERSQTVHRPVTNGNGKQKPEFPPLKISGGFRVHAHVAVGGDDRAVSCYGPIDYGPGLLHIHARIGDQVGVYQFRRYRGWLPFLPLFCWMALSLRRSVPLTSKHVHRSTRRRCVVIQPPWPADFMVTIDDIESSELDRMIDCFFETDSRKRGTVGR